MSAISSSENVPHLFERLMFSHMHIRLREKHKSFRFAWVCLSLFLCSCAATNSNLSKPSYAEGLWLVGTRRTREVEGPMPEMDWPPPSPTSTYELDWTPVSDERLGDIFVRVRAMLREADLLNARVLSIGKDGFAIVTPIESIMPSGAIRSDVGRFSFDEAGRPPPTFSLKYYLDLLLNRAPGRYRLFVILTTPRTIVPKGPAIEWKNLSEFVSQGATNLPAPLADATASPQTRTTFLIYEFERRTSDAEEPSALVRSSISPRTHLVAAGFMR
jgi:hypothetical protein